MSTEIPRRNQINENTELEIDIRKVVAIIEQLPPDQRLTEAVVLLAKAREHLADYIDDIPFQTH